MRTLSPVLQKRAHELRRRSPTVCGLEGVGGRIALDAGFGVGDFEHYAGGHLAGEDSLGSGVYHGFADVTFFEELYALDAFAGDCYLLESLGVCMKL